jgi:DNA-binding transcriptional regulator YhcF (GntR family)
MTTILEEKQKNRWLMLQKVYDMTEGRAEKPSVNKNAVGEQLGWDLETTKATYDYLREEGFLKAKNNSTIVLTHQGVRKVEETAQTSQDIEDLLTRLSSEYPGESTSILVEKAIDNVDRNPDLKSRIVEGLKAGSFAALEKAIDHPVATFFVEFAKKVFKQ